MTNSHRCHLRPLLVGALLLGAVAAPAFAAPTATVTYTVTSNKSSMSATDWTDGTLEMPKFNPAAFGVVTLKSIDLALTSSTSSLIGITNNSLTISSSGEARTRTKFYVAGGNIPDPGTERFRAETNPFVFDLASTASSSGVRIGTKTATTNFAEQGTLAAFTGTENITLTDSCVTTIVLSFTGENVSSSEDTLATLTGSVMYTYYIPEPACLSALAAALCLTLRRRRHQ